jgi:long-chain fatty acid transport protein
MRHTVVDTRNKAIGQGCLLSLLFGFSVLSGSSPCLASSVLETIGAPGSGNGFSSRVLPHGAEATYFNPSLLVDIAPQLAFGTLVVGESSRIQVSPRPTGVAVPDSVLDADLVGSAGSSLRFWPQPTSQLPNARRNTHTSHMSEYVAVGLVKPVWDQLLTVGLFLMVPTSGLLSHDSFFSDEREQYFSNQLHFELLGDRLKVPSLAAALALRATRRLSFGVGMDGGLAMRTQVQLYMPNAANQSTMLIAPQIDTRIAVAPYFAASWRPWDGGLVTTTLHLPKSWTTSGENRLRYWQYTYQAGQNAVVQRYELTQGSEPLRIGLGIGTSGRYGQKRWRIGLQGTWTQWSHYSDRHSETPLDTWQNTVTVGIGWSIDSARRCLFGEIGVAPSPVPDQVGRSNYVDNTRLGTSVGAEFPFSFAHVDYAVGIQLQGQFLVPRSVTKREDTAHPVVDELPDNAVDRLRGLPLAGATGLQTNNPGYPGYSSRGMLLGVSLVLKVLN